MEDPFTFIKPLLEDPKTTEILVDNWQRVYVEQGGRLIDVPSPFPSEQALYNLIDALAESCGRVANESNPMLDLRMTDGSRVNIVLPPIALNGPALTMRKFLKRTFTVEELIGFGALDQTIVDFTRACVQGRLNMAITGGTGSGKTTMLNVVAQMIPEDERILVLQNAFEFKLSQPRVVTLETRPPNLEGRGGIGLRELLQNAVKMRPDRIILTESNGPEMLDMLVAMNNGYDGSLFSLHAASVPDALSRIELLAGQGNPSIPLLSIREQIASAIQVVFYQERLADGRRRITRISEVTGLKDGVVMTRDLFEFRRTGMKEGKIEGAFTPTGVIPSFLSAFREMGIDLPLTLFTPV